MMPQGVATSHPPDTGKGQGFWSSTPAEASSKDYLPLNLHYPGLKKVFSRPPIYIVENFLTMEECDLFIRTAGPLLQRSKTHAIAGARLPFAHSPHVTRCSM